MDANTSPIHTHFAGAGVCFQNNRMNEGNSISSPFKGEGRMRRLRLETGRGMGEETSVLQVCQGQFAPSPPQPSP